MIPDAFWLANHCACHYLPLLFSCHLYFWMKLIDWLTFRKEILIGISEVCWFLWHPLNLIYKKEKKKRRDFTYMYVCYTYIQIALMRNWCRVKLCSLLFCCIYQFLFTNIVEIWNVDIWNSEHLSQIKMWTAVLLNGRFVFRSWIQMWLSFCFVLQIHIWNSTEA